MAARDITLVYGGSAVGLMGAVAGAVMKNGGRVIGVIPELIKDKVDLLDISETFVTSGMHERKQKMYELSDGFVALPGGIGTIEELTEIFTWQQLGYHNKPVAIYNVDSFFSLFTDFLDSAVENGFIKKLHRNRLLQADNPGKLLEKMESFNEKTVDKWSY